MKIEKISHLLFHRSIPKITDRSKQHCPNYDENDRMMDFDSLLSDNHNLSLNQINHSSDIDINFALQIRRDECHDLSK